MPLSRSFNKVYKPYIQATPAFRRELLADAVTTMLAGDLDRGKSILRMYVNGTVGFIALGAALGQSHKVLMRILGPRGNPQARTLFRLLNHFQQAEGITLTAVYTPADPTTST